MRMKLAVIALLLLIPSQVMSGKGYIDMGQAAKEFDTVEQAETMTAVYRGLFTNALNMKGNGQMLMMDDDAMAYQWPEGTIVVLIIKPAGRHLLITMVWVTADPEIEEVCAKLMKEI